MADKEQQEEVTLEEVETDDFWDNDTTDVPEHYIKAFTVTSNQSDVRLLLGNTYREGSARVDLCKLRLIMPHRDFLEFAEYIWNEATLLTKLYKGNGPGPSFTQEEFDLAMEEAYGDD